MGAFTSETVVCIQRKSWEQYYFHSWLDAVSQVVHGRFILISGIIFIPADFRCNSFPIC